MSAHSAHSRRVGDSWPSCRYATGLPLNRSSIARNWALVCDLLSLSISSSMVSTGDRGFEHLAQNPYAVELFFGKQQFFFAGAGAFDVDGGEDAAVDQVAVQMHFHVAGAFELFEDDFVHAAAGVDRGRWR